MSTYLITQATGQQSRSVISHLLAAGAKVHAVVRDLKKVPPVLQDPRITLFQGESKNFDDILPAARGCEGVFLNTMPIPGLPILQAKAVVEACREAAVGSIVVSTATGVSNKEKWDNDATKELGLHEYFSAKSAVEDIVRAGGFAAYTILRPAILQSAFFLPGALEMWPRLPTQGKVDHVLNDGVRLPYTDTYDIGRYAAAALQNPSKFGGQEIELVSEVLTIEEVCLILADISGRPVTAIKRTEVEMEELGAFMGPKLEIMANNGGFDWTTERAKDIQEKFDIPFTSLEAALRREKISLLECLSSSQASRFKQ